MADNKVFEGGIPQGGFDQSMANAGFGISNEAESSVVPGKADSNSTKVVGNSGVTQGKTGTGTNTEFLDASYAGNLSVPRVSGSGDVDNPDTISHADHDDDEDHPNK